MGWDDRIIDHDV